MQRGPRWQNSELHIHIRDRRSSPFAPVRARPPLAYSPVAGLLPQKLERVGWEGPLPGHWDQISPPFIPYGQVAAQAVRLLPCSRLKQRAQGRPGESRGCLGDRFCRREGSGLGVHSPLEVSTSSWARRETNSDLGKPRSHCPALVAFQVQLLCKRQSWGALVAGAQGGGAGRSRRCQVPLAFGISPARAEPRSRRWSVLCPCAASSGLLLLDHRASSAAAARFPQEGSPASPRRRVPRPLAGVGKGPMDASDPGVAPSAPLRAQLPSDGL